MVPFSRNKNFIGQGTSRSTLDDALGPPDGGHRRLGVWGLGGVGYVEPASIDHKSDVAGKLKPSLTMSTSFRIESLFSGSMREVALNSSKTIGKLHK